MAPSNTVNLVRFAYMPDCTLGWMQYHGLRLATIERPWIPSPVHRGGLNARSCVPDGGYRLTRHSGPRFPDTFALSSPELDVFINEPTVGAGRSAILIHVGNWASDVIGCIAVGLAHAWLDNRQAVTSSKVAMNQLRAALAGDPLPPLEIRPTRGTAE